MKTAALKLLKDKKLDRLSQAVKNCKRNSLQVFFSAKTHKPECPFRAIVTEAGSWQKLVGQFLQKHLKSLPVQDPYGVDCAYDVVQVLDEGIPGANFAFSIDVEDLFYSIPHDELLLAVRDVIELSGPIAFQNDCGVSVDAFLELLTMYLSSTVVEFKGSMFLQRRGICIGSCVAPVLCNIFLARFDNSLRGLIDHERVCRIFRYVDDFLIVLKVSSSDSLPGVVHQVVEAFEASSDALSFTHELPCNRSIRFLELQLTFHGDDHLCWCFMPRSKKALLPFGSAHSKIVKRGIISNCFLNALKKSCPHAMKTSLDNQFERLEAAGYPRDLLYAVAESVLQKIKRPQDSTGLPAQRIREKPFEILPYIHKVSHNIKKVAARQGVNIVLSAPCKLASLCSRVARGKTSNPVCTTKHEHCFTKCATSVVYNIPLTCDKVYIGQTGRCINTRLREHHASLSSNDGANLARHCRECGCYPLFSNVTYLGRGKGKEEREIVEAYFIRKSGDRCISTPSICLIDKEFSVLQRWQER